MVPQRWITHDSLIPLLQDSYGFNALAQILPELFYRAGSRKASRHPDNGDTFSSLYLIRLVHSVIYSFQLVCAALPAAVTRRVARWTAAMFVALSHPAPYQYVRPGPVWW